MIRKLFNVSLFLIMVFFLAIVVQAREDGGALDSSGLAGFNQDGLKSYIVVMDLKPVVSYEGDINGYKATKPRKGRKINPNKARVRKYNRFLAERHNASLKAAGVSVDQKIHDYTMALNGFSAILTEAQVNAIKAQKDVVLVLDDQMRYPQTDSSPTFLGLTVSGGPWTKGYDGKGVVVGVIDTGIWPEHPSFADDGSYKSPPVILDDSARSACDFGNTTHNPMDVPFTCNNKLIGARQILDTYRALIGAESDEYDSARDDDGHGTHTASTAAGNSDVNASMYGIPRGAVSGIAPKAHVIAYKGLGNLGGFTSDLAASIDQAVADGVDVINYSIGGGAGSPGADEMAFLFAADAGVFVATSAGNSGPNPATLDSPGTMPWLTTVGANTQSRFWQGTVVLGDGSEYLGASITPGVSSASLVDAEDAGGELCIPGSLNPSIVTGNIVLCHPGGIPRAAKSLAVYQAGGVGTILYENSDVGSLFSDTHWTPAVHMDNTPGLAIKSYIDSAGSAATAEIIAEQIGEWGPAPSMTIFSSRGPNPVAPDIIKPDITAPGIQILAGNTPTPNPGVYHGELFQSIAGTSMSSPHVAGVFALLKQAHPDWSPAIARSAIMTTAYQDVVDNDRVSEADPFDMGAGHIFPGSKWGKGSVSQPGLAYDASFYDYLGFLCDVFPETFADPAGTCSFLESIGIPTEASDLNYPSIGIADLPGSQTVKRTVTSVAKEKGWRTYNVIVDAPPGYSVTIEPSNFRLKRGQSATYYVTITNEGAPIGEWRFGSLTWKEKSGRYNVYSPIAVRASLFGSPTEITVSGTSGSASFDISFGYTGSYTAAPHGLVADAPTTGNIGQDPDQTYPSGDDSSNGVQKIDYSISGAAFVRWGMTIPGDDDIDLYLEDSGGNIIAASTGGGTDELIEMLLPADDTYTLVVHGWSVPNEPLPYTVNYWEVPLASGGSLGVDAAPASATTGQTSTVDVSWIGLSGGTTYLGAVSHTGDTGLMGLTLVEVITP